MEVLSKAKIEEWIVPHLSKGSRGPAPTVSLSDLVSAILYRLKTGVQWRFLPVRQFFEDASITSGGVYHHHRRWIADGSWIKAWTALLSAHRHTLDLSVVQLDGSHTPAKKQGEAIGYQGRKSSKTTNALFGSDKNGQPLAMATPQAGNHHDLYQIQELFEQICTMLEKAGINLRGVFMNADAGFDCQALRTHCEEKEIEANIDRNKRSSKEYSENYVHFDEQLYAHRYVIERTNAWLDGFKTLILRYETYITTWVAAHLMAFIVILLRKL